MQPLITQSIPQQLYTPEQVREFEAEAAERAGLSMWQLMQRAGEAAWQCLQHQIGRGEAPRIAVLAGPGNNGGDGYLLACHALQAGLSVRVFAHGEPGSNEGLQAMQQWLSLQGEIEPLLEWADHEPDWVVDALLGTGLNNPVHGEIRECIEALNEASLPVLAIDVPSGLHAGTGAVLGAAVKAEATVTMVAMKQGLTTAMAADYIGTLFYADLGIQREFRLLTEPSAWLLHKDQRAHLLPPRSKVCQKGNFGHVLVIGGSVGMAGAALMAASAAMRSGAGKVTVICEPGQESLFGAQPELMVLGLAADTSAAEVLLERATVIAIGPGLGQGSWGMLWWQRFCQRSQEKPVASVIDADALNLLAKQLAQGAETPVAEGAVYTPHPGEAARLLQCSVSDVEQNRWQAAATLQELLAGTVILKGAGSIISGPTTTAVNTYGTPALASAGMGDVLTGIIAGLLAQQQALLLETESAAQLGVMLHSLAAEQAAQGDSRGVLASDVIAQIRTAVNPARAAQ